jgi:sugar/nucleoside kinase (ribokinase family)
VRAVDSRAFDFVAVGDVMLDVHVATAPANDRVHEGVTVAAGGSAVNAACAAARLGVRAAVVGCIGDDAGGRAVAAELDRAGVERLLTVVAGGRTGTAVYIADGVVADRGANECFSNSELPDAAVTLVSGYLPDAAVRSALRDASGLRAVDLQGVARSGYDADVVLGPGLCLAELAHRHRVVCSTLAAGGAEAIERGGPTVRVTPPRVLETSPAGAGDIFAAVFLLALADGVPLAECMARGARSVVERVGAERHQRHARRE